jgi:phosphatidylglycerophosphate synthase
MLFPRKRNLVFLKQSRSCLTVSARYMLLGKMIRRNPNKMHSIAQDKADWDGIPDDKLNKWQRIAKRTRGWGTAANGLTLFGTVVVMNGLADFANGHYTSGIIKVGAGRLADLGDGALADKQGVKGPIGKRLDATMDMAQLAVALPVLYTTDTLPIVPLAVIAIPKIVGTAGSLAAEKRGREVNVTSDGKFGTAAIWAGVGSFMVATAIGINQETVSSVFETIGYAGTIGGSLLSTRATIAYARAGFGSQPTVEN